MIGETLRDRVARLVRAELGKLGILTFHEYRVVQQSGPMVDLQAVRKAAGLPDLTRVAARPGAAGYAAQYKPGSLVLVGFVEGDPARPFIAFAGEVGASGTTPLEAAIDAITAVTVGALAQKVALGDPDDLVPGMGAIVREGDTVLVGAISGPLSIVVGGASKTSQKSKVTA